MLKRLGDEGMFELLLKKLLALKRYDGAVALAQNEFKTAYERLLHQYQQRGDAESRLRLLREVMGHQPSIETYRELESVAKGSGQWEVLRPPIIEALKKEKKEIATLARIYLHEQAWDLAWEVVERAPVPAMSSGWGRTYIYGPMLDLEVAQASRKERPHKAIPVFIKVARRHDQRSRNNYAEAAQYLAEVKRLYTQMGDRATWEELITGMRAEFPRLRALLDELKKAGL